MSGPLLSIDASTYRGTAALVDGAQVLGEVEARMRGADEERLMPAVAALLANTGVDVPSLGGVICGEGPGSFTSLRIAASIAKGVVSATGVPLFAVSSLLLIVAGAGVPVAPGQYLALLDAMRGEWFAARVTVDASGTAMLEGEHEILDRSGVDGILRGEHRVAIGPGQPIDAAPHAKGVAGLARRPEAIRPVDHRTWEPSYGRLAEAQTRWEQSHGRPLVA